MDALQGADLLHWRMNRPIRDAVQVDTPSMRWDLSNESHRPAKSPLNLHEDGFNEQSVSRLIYRDHI